MNFSRLSIASVDGKQHLSEIVFSALVGFSLLDKYPTFEQGMKNWCTYRARSQREPGELQDSGFSPEKKSESGARNVLEVIQSYINIYFDCLVIQKFIL